MQDIGLVINPKTAESQIYGGCIMGICSALMEERIMDEQTGRMLNPDMEFYKLAGIGDIGEIVVHLDITPEHDKRGVIGLGEPRGHRADHGHRQRGGQCHRRAGAATYRSLPTGCWRLWKGGMHKCKPSNTPIQQRCRRPSGLLGTQVGRGGCAGRRHRPDQPHEGVPAHAQARGEYQEHQGTGRHPASPKTGLRIGATVTLEELLENADVRKSFPVADGRRREGVTSPQIRNMGTVGGDLCQRPRCWYYRQGFGLLAMKDGKSLVPNGENRYHAILGNGGPAYFVSASSLGPALIALGAKVKLVSATGHREVAVEKFFVTPQNENSREIALLPNEMLTEIIVPHERLEERHVRSAAEGGARLAAGDGFGGAEDEGQHGIVSARIVLGHVAPTPWVATQAEQVLAGKAVTRGNGRRSRQRPRWPTPRRSARTATRCNWRAWR